jgi:NAD(P)-dependent dehydrogenase (short-subunit alcohol dehydrogenase family)
MSLRPSSSPFAYPIPKISKSQSPTTPHRFLQAGASKVYITSRKASACDAAAAALNALPNLQPGAKAISVPADSAKFEGVEHLVKEVSKTTDHVDILFANAGATWGEKFDTHPDGAFAKVMDLNVKSVFNTIRL